MVFQNYALYPNMTVYGNLAFALKVRKASKSEIDEKVHKVARILEIEHLLDRRPGELSGGQKQRVAIARTLLQAAPILIFDDSLGAVDAETDAAIRDALHSRRHGTMFLISHRIATIRKSDLILVLDKGRVVQMGTHDTLAAQEGLYRRVCAIQNELPQAASPKGGEA